jgi:predicted TIM-barrel fold metal-dependent hydrolase
LAQFLQRLHPDHLDQLQEDGGVCIMYTHLGLDFVDERGQLNSEFVKAMTDLADRGGWYVPVSTMLDAVRSSDGCPTLTVSQRAGLERRWILDRVRDRSRFGPRVATHDQIAT